MFKKFKLNSSINRLIEEKLYEIVADEMDRNEIRKGLWAKALAQAGGDDVKVKGKYISLRVESLRDEENVIVAILSEIEGQKAIPIEPKKEIVSAKNQSLPNPSHIETVTSENDDEFYLPNWLLGVIIFIFCIAILIK